MYGHSDPDSFLEAAASRGHRGFGRPKPKTGAKSRAGFTNGRTAPILELAAGSLDFAPSGRLADRPVSIFEVENGPPVKVPRRARSAVVQRRSSAWGQQTKRELEDLSYGQPHQLGPQKQSLTDDSEREQEVAEALFDLANACGPSNGSHEQPTSASPPEFFEHSDTASSSHGSKDGTQAYGPANGKRKRGPPGSYHPEYGYPLHPLAAGRAAKKLARSRQKRSIGVQSEGPSRLPKREPGTDGLRAFPRAEPLATGSLHKGESSEAADVLTPPTEDHKPWKPSPMQHLKQESGDSKAQIPGVKTEGGEMHFPHPMTRSLPRSHKGEISKRKRVEAMAGSRPLSPLPSPRSPPSAAPGSGNHHPLAPGLSGYKGGPLPPLGRPVAGGPLHPFPSAGTPTAAALSRGSQPSSVSGGPLADLSKGLSSNRNGFHPVEPRFHHAPIATKPEPGPDGMLPPSLLSALASRQTSLLDSMQQPLGPFPKLTKNCEMHVHIARLIKWFMRRGKPGSEWGGPGSQPLQPHVIGGPGGAFGPPRPTSAAPPVITPTPQALPPHTQMQAPTPASPAPSPAVAQPTRVAATFPTNVPTCRPEPTDPQAPPTRVVQAPLAGHVQRNPLPFSMPPADAHLPSSQPSTLLQPAANGFHPPSSVPNGGTLPGMSGLLPGPLPSLPPNFPSSFCQGPPAGAPSFPHSFPNFSRAMQQQSQQQQQQNSGWGSHPAQPSGVMGAFPQSLMPSPRQRGRIVTPKSSHDKQEQEGQLPPAAGRPLPGGPRDGLLPMGHKSESPEGKLRAGDPARLLGAPIDHLGAANGHRLLQHQQQLPSVSAAPPQLAPQLSSRQTTFPGSSSQKLKQSGSQLYGGPPMDNSLRNGLPSSSALLQNMQTMANMGGPPAAGMNPFNAQQQHMLHQYHLSMMQQGMNPFFNNPMMLPPGQLPQHGGGVSPHGMLPGFHADAERAARDQLMLQHVQRQLPPPAYPHIPSYLQQRDSSGPGNAMSFHPMSLKRAQGDILHGRLEEPPPQQPAALTPDMIAAAANNINNPLAHMFQGHVPPYSQ